MKKELIYGLTIGLLPILIITLLIYFNIINKDWLAAIFLYAFPWALYMAYYDKQRDQSK